MNRRDHFEQITGERIQPKIGGIVLCAITVLLYVATVIGIAYLAARAF